MTEGTSIYNSQLDAFDLYHRTQEAPNERTSYLGGPALPALGHAIAGAVGASLSNVCTYPLALIITRLQIQRQLRKTAFAPHSEEYKSIQNAVEKIYNKEGGIKGFYVGVVSDTSKTIADSFLFFLAYNFIRQSRVRSSMSPSRHLPVVDELSVGFLAGALSKFLTTPIANIVTRKQTSSMLSARTPGKATDQGTVRSIALQIHAEKGIRGFWSGYSASLVLTLNPSLTFFFFETLKRTLLPREQRSDPSPKATFLLAAISKACASSITYPFSLAKSRLQASGRSENQRDESGKFDTEGFPASSEQPQTRPPSNVFAMILQIARTEGIGALYEGLGGEVLKGFFSHGITMIVKEAVHKIVIRLYYTILKLLKKYPSPHELAGMAKGQAEQAAIGLGQQAREVSNIAEEGMRTVAEKGQEIMASASDTVKSRDVD